MSAVTAALRPLYDVAIVGLGPVGASLANLLALRGLKVLALDREAAIHPLPRAIHFDAECMRVFQTVGIADKLAPDLVVAPGMRFVAADGRLLIDWNRPTELGPQGWHASYRFHQPILERHLRERLAAHGAVDIRLRQELLSLEETEADCTLHLHDKDDGQMRSCRAGFVVGCDGARSTVRRLMNSAMEDLQSHERWLVADLLLNEDMPELGDHAVQYCDPARPATYVRGVGLRRRWELMLLPGEDAAVMSRPENLWKLLSRWISPQQARLERPTAYTFHAMLAEGWRRGRLLIAGDAAHQTPPFLGQGMCAGIRDAANLAWKLADVAQGRAHASLLDSYESERSPHVREMIAAALRLGRVIQTTDPEAARLRDAELLQGPQQFHTPQPRLGAGAHDGSPQAGWLGEQPRMADGMLLDEQVGYHPALLLHPRVASPAVTLTRIVRAESNESRQWLDRLQTDAVLLRPDRYVAAVGASALQRAA